jgi:hypothetical protein
MLVTVAELLHSMDDFKGPQDQSEAIKHWHKALEYEASINE